MNWPRNVLERPSNQLEISTGIAATSVKAHQVAKRDRERRHGLERGNEALKMVREETVIAVEECDEVTMARKDAAIAAGTESVVGAGERDKTRGSHSTDPTLDALPGIIA